MIEILWADRGLKLRKMGCTDEEQVARWMEGYRDGTEERGGYREGK